MIEQQLTDQVQVLFRDGWITAEIRPRIQGRDNWRNSQLRSRRLLEGKSQTTSLLQRLLGPAILVKANFSAVSTIWIAYHRQTAALKLLIGISTNTGSTTTIGLMTGYSMTIGSA